MMQTRNRSQPRASHPLFLDALESRLFLSSTPSTFSPLTPGQNFDLLPSITKLPKLATSIITGTAVKGTVTIHLANTGQDPSPAATLSVFLRPNAGGTDINITTTPVNIPALKGAVTKNGVTKDSTKDVSAKVALPLNLTAGNYSLVVIVTDTSTGAAQANNTLVDNAFTLAAAPGAFNVATTLTTSKVPATTAVGSKIAGKLSLNFTNSGNIPTPAVSEYNISLFLKPISGNNLLLITLPNVKVPIIKANGGIQSIGTNLTLSTTATAAIPAGSYTLIAILAPTGPTLGLPFTVNGPAINFTASNSNPGVLLQHGNTISFTSTFQFASAFLLENGTFTTNLSVNGNYQLAGGQLTLTYATGGSDVIQVTYTGAATYFDPTLDNSPTTVTFSTDPNSAFASLLISGDNFSAFAKFA